MTRDRKTAHVTLDWSNMLGFDQVRGPRTVGDADAIKEPRLLKLAAKLSGKPGIKNSQAR